VSARILLVLILVSLAPGAGWAQPPSPSDRAETVEVDPIRCWWRTSAGAVRTGETFSIILTCAVLEAEGVEVVPDETRLDDSVIQLTPFEVVSGSHPPDLRSGLRRFFQYEYVVRVISPDAIGRDVGLPSLVLHYRVNSRLPGNAALQGRDLTYLLPPHSIRVLSMVPVAAADIRDMPDERFGRVEALLYRAGVLEIIAIGLIGVGGLMTVVALVGLARRVRRPAKTQERTLSERVVAALAATELAAVQRETEGQGWNDTLVGRANAALRVTAACAIGRSVSQRPAGPDAETGEGRLVRRSLRRRGGREAVSSAVTTEDVAREMNRLPPTAPPARRQLLETLHGALVVFAVAQYGQQRDADRAALDQALASAVAIARQLKVERLWPREYFRRWSAQLERT